MPIALYNNVIENNQIWAGSGGALLLAIVETDGVAEAYNPINIMVMTIIRDLC